MKIFVLGTRGFPNVQGGVEKYCEQLYPRVVNLGVDVLVFARKNYFDIKNSVWHGVKFCYLWCPRKKGIEAFIHTLFASIVTIFKKPDIAHFHNIGPAIFLPLVRLFGIKTVLTYHSINYLHQKWNTIEKFILKTGEFLALKFADKIIVVSETTKKFLEKKYNRKDLTVIQSGVNLPKIISAGEIHKKYALQPKKYIFTACRFVPEKGLHNLISAYRKIKNPEFKLVIAGDADYETKYSRDLKKLANETQGVILTGVLTGQPLAELYSNAGLFVLPSYYEGLPIALLEALSYGLPVLVSDIPQHREIPLSEFRYFKVNDVDELAKKIVELYNLGISNEEKQRYLGLLKEHYNWDKIAKSVFEVYKGLVAEKI
jgi:glycosyltransferase involved in cell wall biosynthesis